MQGEVVAMEVDYEVIKQTMDAKIKQLAAIRRVASPKSLYFSSPPAKNLSSSSPHFAKSSSKTSNISHNSFELETAEETENPNMADLKNLLSATHKHRRALSLIPEELS